MSEEKADTIIGEDIIFKGTLRFNNSLRLKGQMKGTIESNGNLIVDETGQVDADIIVSSLAVNGSLRGNVEASERDRSRKNWIHCWRYKNSPFKHRIRSKIVRQLHYVVTQCQINFYTVLIFLA